MSIYDILKNKRRVMLDLSEAGLPEVPLIGVNIQTCAADKLKLHQHKGLFEIVYMVRGQQSFTVDDTDYMLKSNDVFITHPDKWHSSGSHIMEKAFFYWMQIQMPTAGKTILSLDVESSAALCNSLKAVQNNHFAGNERIAENFEEIFKICRSDNPLRKITISSKLVDILLTVIQCSSAPQKHSISEDIRSSIQLIENAPNKFVSIDEMAQIAGLSVSRFKCKFKRQTGLPPGEYQLRNKITNAQNQLETTDKTITQIAFENGFSSSQYFATVYKKFTHTSPKDTRSHS